MTELKYKYKYGTHCSKCGKGNKKCICLGGHLICNTCNHIRYTLRGEADKQIYGMPCECLRQGITPFGI